MLVQNTLHRIYFNTSVSLLYALDCAVTVEDEPMMVDKTPVDQSHVGALCDVSVCESHNNQLNQPELQQTEIRKSVTSDLELRCENYSSETLGQCFTRHVYSFDLESNSILFHMVFGHRFGSNADRNK